MSGKGAKKCAKVANQCARSPTSVQGRQISRKIAKTTHTEVGDLGDLTLLTAIP
jgi:hypothetical protein